MPRVLSYLERESGGGSRRTPDGWTWFCGLRYLGSSTSAGSLRVYVWAGCQEYRASGGGLAESTGFSRPVVVTLVLTGHGYRPVAQDWPGEGAYYFSDVSRMFPRSAQHAIREIPESTGQGSAAALFADLKRRARRELVAL